MTWQEFELEINFERSSVFPIVEDKNKVIIEVIIDDIFSPKEIDRAVKKCLFLNNLISFENAITMRSKNDNIRER